MIRKMPSGVVAANQHLKGTYWLLSLKFAGPLSEVNPGRFVMLAVNDLRDPLLRRPFGIHDYHVTEDGSGFLKILYRVCGRGTSLMSRFKPDEPVELLGPLGKGFSPPTDRGRAVIAAGGIGSAPLLYLARRLIAVGSPVNVYLGGNAAVDLLGAEDFAALGAAVHTATMDGSRGFTGTVVDLLAASESGGGKTSVYACGPWAMLKALADLCRARKWPMQASVDAVMACGLGLCRGCAVPAPPGGDKYLMACQDGPVFNLEDLIW